MKQKRELQQQAAVEGYKDALEEKRKNDERLQRLRMEQEKGVTAQSFARKRANWGNI